MTAPTPEPTAARPRSRWRRWAWRLAALALLVAFRAPLLRSLAGLLAADDPATAADAVLVGGPDPYDTVARVYHAGQAREVLVIEDHSSRLVRAGILPPAGEFVGRELAARGLPAGAVTVFPGEFRTGWAAARCLRGWLEARPGATATVLCGEFHGRTSRRVVRRVLGPELAARVRWRAVPDPRFGPADWWHTRHGVVEVGSSVVTLAHTYLFGEPPEGPRWDPEEYERSLRPPAAAP